MFQGSYHGHLIQFCKIWFYIDTLFGATLMVIPVFGTFFFAKSYYVIIG